MNEINFKICDSLDEVKHFKTDVETFSDIETQFLYVNTRLVQVFQPETDRTIYILDTDIIPLEDIKAWLKPLWTIWQGCTYDFGTLNMTTSKFDDTLLLARSAYPEWKEFKLDNIVSRLGYDYLYDGLDKKELQKMGFVPGAYLSQEQLRYAATDVYALYKIWQDLKIQETRNLLSYKIDILSIGYAIQYQQNNLYVYQSAVRDELDAVEVKIKDYEAKLGGLNCNSPKQVKEALGTTSSDKKTLIKLIGEGNALAEAVFTQRRQLKRKGFLNKYNYPWVETRFNPAGAATGRFTSTGGDLERGINAQQITRNLQYLFHQPMVIDNEETVVLHADYSTAQLRLGCSIMGDETMYNELKAGHDLHKLAVLLVHTEKTLEEVTKAERQKGKAINFGLIFGMSAPAFQEYAYVEYGVKFTLEECQIIKRRYDTKYQQIKDYHNYWWQNYKSTPVVTPAGRRNLARLGTDAINFGTQGGEADMTKLASHYLCRDNPEALKYIFNIVHDAIYMRVPLKDVELWADRLVKAMKKGWEEVCKLPMLKFKDIPMPVEYSYILPDGTEVEVEV
jgi:DNA polymerase I-like protein with 3'-5' exonuclease and polymerase domains